MDVRDDRKSEHIPRMILLTRHEEQKQCGCGQHRSLSRFRVAEHVVLWKNPCAVGQDFGDMPEILKQPFTLSDRIKQRSPRFKLTKICQDSGNLDSSKLELPVLCSQKNFAISKDSEDKLLDDFIQSVIDSAFTTHTDALHEDDCLSDTSEISEWVVSELLKEQSHYCKSGSDLHTFKLSCDEEFSDWVVIRPEDVADIPRSVQYVGVYVLEAEDVTYEDVYDSESDMSDWELVHVENFPSVESYAGMVKEPSHVFVDDQQPGCSHYRPRSDSTASISGNSSHGSDNSLGFQLSSNNGSDNSLTAHELPGILGGADDSDMAGIFGVVCNKSNGRCVYTLN